LACSWRRAMIGCKPSEQRELFPLGEPESTPLSRFHSRGRVAPRLFHPKGKLDIRSFSPYKVQRGVDKGPHALKRNGRSSFQEHNTTRRTCNR
jgi:hypothetical protein